MTINKQQDTLSPSPLLYMMGQRAAIAAAIETLINVIDLIDGDPDVEANGDETDHSNSEDCFVDHYGTGPGCPVSDPGGCEHDGREQDHDG